MSRVGRGRPASSLIRGGVAQTNTRTGAVTASAGGSAALSVAPVLNLISNPTFNGSNSMPGWTTSGFSLVSGAVIGPATGVGEFSVSAIDQGVNYAPPGLTTFLAGVRYYAEVKLVALAGAFGENVPIELVLGSTSDDYAVTQYTLTGIAMQTVRVSWVPQADRSAVDHGLAIRVKSVPVSFFKSIDVDDAIIATADGFWSGWRVGGKGAAKAVTTSAGGAAALTTGQRAAGTIAGHAGGTATLTAKKTPSRSLTTSGGGNAVVVTTAAHSAAITASGGGSAILTRSTVTNLLPPSGLFGGGGRTGRSHPVAGVVTRGVGSATSLFGRSGTLTASGGGTATLTGGSARRGQTAAGAGSTIATTVAKGGKGALTTQGGGAVVLSGARVAETGGIIATFLMGGGGRIGRSHPAPAIVTRGRVTLSASSPDNRSGNLAASGGGSGTTAIRKGGTSSTPVAIPAPPPVFVETLTLPGLLSSGGGRFAYSYTRSATQVGSATTSAGGTGAFTATKKVAGTLTASGGGNPTLTPRRGARSSLTGSGGGGFTYSYVTFEARRGTLASSGGGGATLSGKKQGTATLSVTGGGTLVYRAPKGARATLTATGGGGATISYTTGGLAASGTIAASGGGTGTIVSGRSPAHSLTAGAGGTLTIVAAKGAAYSLTATGGGTGRLRRPPRAGSFAPFPAGRIEPVRIGHIEPEGVLIR